MQVTESERAKDKQIVVLIYWDKRYQRPIAFDEKCGPWTMLWTDKRISELEFLGNMKVSVNEEDLLLEK